MMLKRIGIVLLLLTLLAVACSDDEEEAAGGETPTGETAAIPVQVDGEAATYNAAFIAYFPNEVTAHPGDQIDFTEVFSGEPHTVAFGTNVDDVFALIAEACPNGGLVDPACQEGPPEAYADRYNQANAKLPELITEDFPPQVLQSAAQPCFLDTGPPPPDAACTADHQQQPEFNGTQTFYNSGYLEDQQVFAVQLADDIAPGVYNFYCLLHREGMSGTVTVVDEDTAVPSAAEVRQEGEDQLAALASQLQPEFDKLASLTADTAQAGSGLPDVQNAEIDEFGPEETDIPVGGSVTWTVLGPHTISFNPPESARPILVRAADGTVSLNEEAAAPQGGPGQPPPPEGEAPPPDENASPVLIDAGEWDGQGFLSSGLILSFPPELYAYKVTFTTVGTYPYICLIHPDMEGTVTVTE